MSGEGPRLIAHSYRDRARGPGSASSVMSDLPVCFHEAGLLQRSMRGGSPALNRRRMSPAAGYLLPRAILGAVIAAVSVSSRDELPQLGLPHAADRIVLPERDFLGGDGLSRAETLRRS